MSTMKWLLRLGAAGLAGGVVGARVGQRNAWRRIMDESIKPSLRYPVWPKPAPFPSPWAILLCKFDDDDTEPYTRDYYEDLFTASGIGTSNMVDYFHDMSHGQLDLSGSRVFGWYKLGKKRSDYKGQQSDRPKLISWARTAATAAGVDLSLFAGIVVCTNVNADEFGGGIGVAVGGAPIEPRILGQEMAHVYGLNHSRIWGSDLDYMDPWDVMSTRNASSAPHKRYGNIGPGINAANMANLNWLDERRVWSSNARSFDTKVTLRPLHRPDLPGYLAARIGDLFVEFRVKSGWDAGINRSVVLIHSADELNMRSVLHPANNGRPAMVTGSVFGSVEPGGGVMELLKGQLGVKVLDIDEEGETVQLRLVYRPAIQLPQLAPGRLFGGVAVGGGGIMIIGRKIVRIPPRSPLLRLMDQAAVYESSEAIPYPTLREAVRQQSLRAMVTVAQQELAQTQRFNSPAPEEEL